MLQWIVFFASLNYYSKRKKKMLILNPGSCFTLHSTLIHPSTLVWAKFHLVSEETGPHLNSIFCLGTKGGRHKRAHVSVNPKLAVFTALQSCGALRTTVQPPTPTVTVYSTTYNGLEAEPNISGSRWCCVLWHSMKCVHLLGVQNRDLKEVTWGHTDQHCQNLGAQLIFALGFGCYTFRTFHSCQILIAPTCSYEPPTKGHNPV